MAFKSSMVFQYQPEHTIYILQGYAAFIPASDILTKFLEEFTEHLKYDIEKEGYDVIKKRVHGKIKELSPERKNFPQKWRPEFDKLRLEWMESATKMRGYHRAGRLEELEKLLKKTLAQPLVEKEFTYKDQASLAIKIISEMRQEGDKAQIFVEQEQKPNQLTDEMSDMLKDLTPDQMKELRDARAANKPLQPILNQFRIANTFGDDGTGHAGLTDTPGTPVVDSTGHGGST